MLLHFMTVCEYYAPEFGQIRYMIKEMIDLAGNVVRWRESGTENGRKFRKSGVRPLPPECSRDPDQIRKLRSRLGWYEVAS